MIQQQRAKCEDGSPSWKFAGLLMAPHRLGFFMAGAMLALSAVWWALVLLGRVLHWEQNPAVPLPLMHGLLMSLGYMPLFICGFLYTAGPKWLDVHAVAAKELLPMLALMLVGWVIAWPGLQWQHWLGAAGIGMVGVGWLMLSWKFFRMVCSSLVDDKVHLKLVSVACLFGAVLMEMAAVALALDSQLMLRSVIHAGLWWFLAPVFAVMSHRMLPFFSASVLPMLDNWRPLWLLWVLVGSLCFEGWVSIVDLWWWPMPALLRWFQVAVELILTLLMGWLALRWGLVQSLKIRILAMFHGGFVWLGLSFAFNAVSHGLMAYSGDTVSLGLAPLHAMTMGYLGATMFAMVTRVSSGHGGRKQPADNVAWTLYWVLQLAVVLRVVAATVLDWSVFLLLCAAGAWCVVAVSWFVRYGSWFGTPRADGRPE